MEIWIGFGGMIIAFSALWWKVTTSLVTKDDLKEMRRQIDDRFGRIENDIRELRQFWTTHLTEQHRTKTDK